MKRCLVAVCLSLALWGCATVQAPQDLLARAVHAGGGVEGLARAQTLVLKGSLKQYDPEQSYAPGGEAKHTNDADFTLTADLAGGRSRIDWVKRFKYPFEVTRSFAEIVTPQAGYVLGIDSLERSAQSLQQGSHAMSGLRLAVTQRELRRASPALLLEMQAQPQRLSARPAVAVGGVAHAALDYRADGVLYTVLFDPATGLPARIRTADYDNIWGDVDLDLVLSDWQVLGGVRVATRQRMELRGQVLQDLRISELQAWGPAAAGTFDVPAALQAGASAPATGALHTQWPIRRQFIGTYLDSDHPAYDTRAPGAGLKLAELAPSVLQQVGGSHNSLVVEMSNHLIVFDAPVTDGQSLWTLDALKARFPGKPVLYLVLTHHHMDHAGGLRAYLAQGATLVVGKGAAEHFRQVLAAPTTRSPDLKKTDLSHARIVEVEERQLFSDGKRNVWALPIDNPHAAGYLLGYVEDARLAWVTDLWSPGRPMPPRMNPGLQSVVSGVKKAGIAPLRFAGGHGSVAPYALLEGLAVLGAK